ncbi:MAG TPA: hypothetical protein VF509_16725 [Sphingobium sp.]
MMMKKSVARLVIALSLIIGSASAGHAQAQLEDVTVTEHQIQLNGQQMQYTASAGRIPIRASGSDDPHAQMFFVAYRARTKDANDRTPRPLTVIWNGGPGGPALSILLGGQGPKRIEADSRIVDNEDTILADTDLLFIDAVGSGFSRMTRPEYAKEFYQTRGDNDAFIECVLAWRRLFKAEDQPLYLGGISWGGYRVAAMGNALEKRGVHVSGEIYMSGRTGLSGAGPEQKFAPLQIVNYPRIALFHGKLSPSLGTDIDAIEQQVKSWALETYMPALQRLPKLTVPEREAIAAKLALYSGLPLAKIDRRSLVVTPTEMLTGLLADRKQQLVTNDMRDIAGKGDPALKTIRFTAAVRYLRDDLAYRTALAYAPSPWEAAEADAFAPTGSEAPEWDYLSGYYSHPRPAAETKAANEKAIAQGYPPGGQDIPLTDEAMHINPKMKLLVVNGRFDSLRSCASTQEQLKGVEPALRSRITFRCVDGGHGFFLNNPAVRRTFNADIRALIADRLAP